MACAVHCFKNKAAPGTFPDLQRDHLNVVCRGFACAAFYGTPVSLFHAHNQLTIGTHTYNLSRLMGLAA